MKKVLEVQQSDHLNAGQKRRTLWNYYIYLE